MIGNEPLCSKTHEAICNLIDGKVDVVFALLPTEVEKKYMKEKDVDLKARCYAYDALMILGNSQNPVQNLSSKQLRDIYRKKITNWKDVGGIDAEISVYVRDKQSGSQRMFESLVWAGQKDIPDFQDGSYNDMEIDEMGEIINMVEQDVNSIGFSFMTFVDGEFGTSEYLKSFAIDNINPTNSNIANQSYPFITTAWMLMRADEPSNSPAQWLFDWFVGENAQKYITQHTSSIPANNDPIIITAK
jgi:phosphate transport system substrate-binding protein